MHIHEEYDFREHTLVIKVTAIIFWIKVSTILSVLIPFLIIELIIRVTS